MWFNCGMTTTAFRAQGGTATYLLAEITPEMAAYVGCVGATHRLQGRNLDWYGTVKQVTGNLVRVPGWPSRRGVLAIFTPAVLDEFVRPLKGWVGE